jgi:hypothetical protein
VEEELDIFEDDLIEKFRQHPILKNLELLTDPDFVAILLQRRFLSLAFTPAYDLAIDLLNDKPSLKIARVILREEYPGSKGYTRSHREDMKEDLLQLGVSRRDLVETRPTDATVRAIRKTLTLIPEAAAGDYADAQLLTILRFWGEVLVSVEYGELWRRMAPRLEGEGENRSRFYYPHHIHDKKMRPLATASMLSSTHSDQLGVRLRQLLDSHKARNCFMRIEKDILLLKMQFYDQFTPMLKHVEVGTSARL